MAASVVQNQRTPISTPSPPPPPPPKNPPPVSSAVVAGSAVALIPPPPGRPQSPPFVTAGALNPGRDREAQLMRRVRELEEEVRVVRAENEKQVRVIFIYCAVC